MTFYATIDCDTVRSFMPAVPYMLPASSWARVKLQPPRLPAQVTETAADCGGFVATFRWGDYRYTPAQYATWLASFQPRWAAMMDYCCEDELTKGQPGLVRERQQRTTRLARLFWRRFRNTSWLWTPTIQGWQVEDYRQHARELRPLIQTMRQRYQSPYFRVGVGTLCRRARPALIRAVVQAVSEELPGIPLHLWGVKLTSLRAVAAVSEAVASIDSAAWNNRFGRGLEEYRRSALSQRRYAYEVALPAYLAKVQQALAVQREARGV